MASGNTSAQVARVHYYGESTCEKVIGCRKKAYYTSSGKPACGIHSKVDAKRKGLPKNPDKAKNELLQLEQAYQLALSSADLNRERGKMSLRRLGMMKPVPMVDGFFTVLPNNKALPKGRVIWAMNELSPMQLGPVKHTQPGINPAMNIENFHQFNKVFQSEINPATGNPHEAWYTRRDKGYADSVPHRHKLGPTKEAHMKAAGIAPGGNANACAYSIYIAPDGTEYHFDYVSSRVFYCTYYDRLARQTESLHKLMKTVYIKKQNIVIAGYDARWEDDEDITAEKIDAWYKDPTKPFGHEMVLHAILFHWYTPEELPWRKAAAELDFEI
jgi:hypothetical protein